MCLPDPTSHRQGLTRGEITFNADIPVAVSLYKNYGLACAPLGARPEPPSPGRTGERGVDWPSPPGEGCGDGQHVLRCAWRRARHKRVLGP